MRILMMLMTINTASGSGLLTHPRPIIHFSEYFYDTVRKCSRLQVQVDPI